MTLSSHDKIVFFKVIHGDIGLNEFEQWLYENKALEECISEASYLDLVELNYKKSGAKYELYRKLENVIDFGEYEKWKLNHLLDVALKRDESFAMSMMGFYDLYCDGYYFLNDLGLGYGLMFTVPPSKHGVDSWDELTQSRKDEQINELYPDIEREVKKVKYWLDCGKIVLTGKKDELNRHCFEDFRTDEEKKSEVWLPVSRQAIERKKWWRFW